VIVISRSTGSASTLTMSLGSGSGGLSTGVKAGIGVGVVAGTIALLSRLSFFSLQRRRLTGAPRTRIQELLELEGSGHMPHEVEGKERSQEIESRPPAELAGD
jgi:hypothetical protein